MEFQTIETDDDDAGSIDPTTTGAAVLPTTLGKKKKAKKKKKGSTNSNNSFPFPWSETRRQLITLQTSTEKGRYLTAAKSLTPGTVFFREVPFVAQLSVEGCLCSTCYCQLGSDGGSSSIVRDDLSTVDLFCSTQCRSTLRPVLMMEKDVMCDTQLGSSTVLSTIAARTSCSVDLLRIVVRCLCKMVATAIDPTGGTNVDAAAGTVAETMKDMTMIDETDATHTTAVSSIPTGGSTTTDCGDLKTEGAPGCFIDNGDIIRATNTGLLTLEHHLDKPGTHSTAWTESITAAFTLLLPQLHLPSPYNDVAFAVALAARINVNAYEMTAMTNTRSTSSSVGRLAAVSQQGQCMAPSDIDLPPHRALGFGLFPALGASYV